MLTNVWKNCHASICSLNFINERGITIDSLTGFKVNNSLVTSEQAFYIPKAKKVEIRFVDEDANTETASMKIDYKEFINDLKIGFANNKADYAIFNIDFPDFQALPSLSLCEGRHFPIGQQLAILGYNGGCPNLSIKTAIISSAYSNSNGVRFLQIDGLTCYGNSGAPVIDPETMQVVAIVSRRNTPAAKSYQQLQDIISANLEELRKIEGNLKMGDLDPIQILIANQNQIKLLAGNIYKYVAMGVSQAVMLDQIITYFNEQAIENKLGIKNEVKVSANF